MRTARDHEEAYALRDHLLDEVVLMLKRWNGHVFTKHIDVGLLERVIRERNALERQLMFSQETIRIIRQQHEADAEILAHFDPVIYEQLKKRAIKKKNAEQQMRVLQNEREAHDRSQDTGVEGRDG